MFKQRLLTALVLAPCLLALLFWAPAKILFVIFFAVLMIGAYEWHKLIPLTGFIATTLFFVVYAAFILLINYYNPEWFIYSIFIWIPIIFFIIIYPRGTFLWAIPVVIFIVSTLVTCLFAYAMQNLYAFQFGRVLIIYLFFIVWAADVGAYTFGKLWGSHKLIPKVSPGKSWEGFIGGLIFVSVIAVIGTVYLNPISFIQWFILIYCTFIVSIFGDLFISMLKRKCKLKDTGNILPGHGGILDRLDSLISAAPVFCAGLSWLNLGLY